MIELITSLRVVPVVTKAKIANIAALVNTLIEAGLPIAEITLRTPESFELLSAATKNSQILVGVGSLRNGEDLKRAVDLGARFAVSAGFSHSVAAVAAKLTIPYFPGVATPTEILQAIDCGITEVKFFPAETLGGTSAIRAMAAPFPGIKFMPTGGINIENAREYLNLSEVFAVGGSWMVAPVLIDNCDFDRILKLASNAVEVCRR